MPAFEDEISYLQWRKQMRQTTKRARESAQPRVAKNVKYLMSEYPWLQPGTALGLAKQDMTGEKAHKVALADLYYQATETNRFGPTQEVSSPQERLQAWESELRGYIRSERKNRDLEAKGAGAAFGDSEAANQNPSRVARFGDMDLDEVRAMRRTVRAALATQDPTTMNAVLGTLNRRSQVSEDPYDASRSFGRTAGSVLGAAGSVADWVIQGQAQAARHGQGQPLMPVGVAVADPNAGVKVQQSAGQGLKATVRGAAVAANMGIEGVAGAQRGVVGFAGDVGKTLGLEDAFNPAGPGAPQSTVTQQSGIDPLSAQAGLAPQGEAYGLKGLSPLAILEQTQGGQALIDLVKGRPVDVGSGWLPDYESATGKAAAEASREYSPYLVNGHAWTIGRGSADVLGLEPDSAAFTVVSGLVDGTQAFVADPANFGLAVLGKANRARKVFDLDEAGDIVSRVRSVEAALGELPDDLDDVARSAASADILDRAGVGVGRRAFLRGKNPIDWLYGEGTPIVRALTDETDPWTIYWALDGRVPIQSDTGQNVLRDLARSQSEAEVRTVLSRELGTSIDRIPQYREGMGMSKMVFGRLSEDMPNRVLNLDDTDGAARTLISYLSLGKVPEAEQRRIFNALVESQGRGDDYAVVDAAWEAVRAQLLAAGQDSKVVDELLRRSKTEWDRASVYGVDSATGDDLPLRLQIDDAARVNEDSPFEIPQEVVELSGPRWVTERFNSQVILPDPKSIRRMVASPAWRAMVNTKSWGAGMWLADTGNDAWKFLMLMRGAWPVRVIGDEMLRMAGTGQSPFLHPINYLALVMGNPKDSRLLNWVERLGSRPSPEAFQDALDARAARTNELVEAGWADPAEVRRMVDEEMPIPRSFGQRWAASGRKFKTRAARAGTDTSGAPFDVNDLYGEALTSRLIGTSGPSRRMYLNHFDVAERESPYWARGLVDDTYRIFSDRVTRRALRMDTDSFLEGLWSEDWGKYARKQMAAGREAGDPWLRVANSREASDAYGRAILDQLQNFHRGDQDLIDAMLSGNFRYTNSAGEVQNVPLTYGGHANPEAVDIAETMRGAGRGPDHVKVQRSVVKTLNQQDQDLDALNGFVDGAFDFLMTKPSNFLTRSPTFRQKYWDEVETLVPSMDQKAQATLRKTLGRANLSADQESRILAKLDEGGYGHLSHGQADTILKRRGLNHTRGLLYDLHKRSQFFDAARLIFPFGEAWKEVLTTWTKIIADHPNDLRRVQQGIQGARGAVVNPITGLPTGEDDPHAGGFFRKDPTTGEEVFTYPLSAWLSQQSVDIPVIGKVGADMPVAVPMRGPTKSLNLVLQGLPGVGLAVSVPLSSYMPDKPVLDPIKDLIFPYGEPEGSGMWDKLVSSFKPTWVERAEKSSADPRTDRIWGNTIFDVMAVLNSTGEYKVSGDPDAAYELNRLYGDAKEKAKWLQRMRAVGAFSLPASPGLDFYVKENPENENLILLQQLRDDWVEKRSELYEKGVPDASAQAFKWFINRYGVDNIFATQSKTELNVVGLEPTKQMRTFERENPDIVQTFPKTWGLFAPSGGDFDYNVYTRQVDAGYRDPLAPDEMARGAVERRGWAVYDKARKMVPEIPTREQSIWLRDVREQLARDFPGWTGAFSGNQESAAQMAELALAATDPRVQKTDVGKALGFYFEARAKANEAVATTATKSSSFTSSKETAEIREWLRDVADDLAAEFPGFGRVWEQVLSRELEDDE